MAVAELEKPAQQWCTHCDPGHGCRIHEARPPICRGFECQWLMADPLMLDDSFRPDRIKVVMSSANGRLLAYCDAAYPEAWRAPKVLTKLRLAAAATGHSIVRVGDRFWIVTAEEAYETTDFSLFPGGGFEIKGPPAKLSALNIDLGDGSFRAQRT